MGAYYGTRKAIAEPQTEGGEGMTVDYSVIPELIQKIDVSIGSSAYWSELMQMQTVDNLMKAGIITDAVLYLESIPDKWIPNKQNIIDGIKNAQQTDMPEDGGLANSMEMQMRENPATYEEMLG